MGKPSDQAGPAAAKLKQLRERAGYSVRELAGLIGKKPTTYADYERVYKKEWLPMALVKALLPVLVGRGQPPIESGDVLGLGGHFGGTIGFAERPSPASSSGPSQPPLAAGDGVEYRGKSYASLPVYDVAVSAGPGAFNSDHAEPEGWYLLGLDHIRRVTRARFEDLALVRVSGDSMAPTLLNDDQILVDRSVHKVGRDGMYVIATGEEVQVKRIMRDWASKTLTVASDNPSYEPSRGVQEDDIVILGRVVWISRNVGG